MINVIIIIMLTDSMLSSRNKCVRTVHMKNMNQKKMYMDELEILPPWENPNPERLLCNRDLSNRIKFADLKQNK